MSHKPREKSENKNDKVEGGTDKPRLREEVTQR